MRYSVVSLHPDPERQLQLHHVIHLKSSPDHKFLGVFGEINQNEDLNLITFSPDNKLVACCIEHMDITNFDKINVWQISNCRLFKDLETVLGNQIAAREMTPEASEIGQEQVQQQQWQWG